MTTRITTLIAAAAIVATALPTHASAQVTYTKEQEQQAMYWMQPDTMCGTLGKDPALDDQARLAGCEALLAGMDAEFRDPQKRPKSQFVENFYWMSRAGLLGAIALYRGRLDGDITRRVCVAHLDGLSAETMIDLDAWPQELREGFAIDTSAAEQVTSRCVRDFPDLG
ncbi:hypothetical protein [Paraurantiacibacter namhicola]|nr:hypothetical protein [Paraurantiacibacter namhicola]